MKRLRKQTAILMMTLVAILSITPHSALADSAGITILVPPTLEYSVAQPF